jgi:hypothetical protein
MVTTRDLQQFNLLSRHEHHVIRNVRANSLLSSFGEESDVPAVPNTITTRDLKQFDLLSGHELQKIQHRSILSSSGGESDISAQPVTVSHEVSKYIEMATARCLKQFNRVSSHKVQEIHNERHDSLFSSTSEEESGVPAVPDSISNENVKDLRYPG